MKFKIALALIILHSAAGIAAASPNAAFAPRRAPDAPCRAALEVRPAGMAFVRGELDGKPCTMLFDTGATHTTFDVNFVKREFPDAQLTQIVDAGDTNVAQNPSIFQVGTLKIGEAEFGEFSAMAIDMSPMQGIAGMKFDGVLGQNVIDATRTLLSVGGAEVVFGLGEDARDAFAQPARRFNDRFDFTILLVGGRGGGNFPVIVDSASSFTFLPAACAWPATTNVVAFTARDVNGSTGMAPKVGERGVLTLNPGAPVEISPLLNEESLSRIGADTLRAYDILIEARAVGFRKHENKETKNETASE